SKGFRKFIGRFIGSSWSLLRKIGACQRRSLEFAKIFIKSRTYQESIEWFPRVRRKLAGRSLILWTL
ncbi:unnamed protein product, partial [Musa textilis]